MTKTVLEGEEIKKQVAKAIVGGHSQREIAEAIGVSQPTISRMLKKGDVKAFIEEEQMKILDLIPQAIENFRAMVNEMPAIPPREVKRRELAFKASVKVLEAAGILNTGSQSPTIANITQKNTILLDPRLQQLLEQYYKSGVKMIGEGDNDEL